MATIDRADAVGRPARPHQAKLRPEGVQPTRQGTQLAPKHKVERLDQRHEPQQDDAYEPVERVHGLAQQRRAVGVMEQVGMPRKLLEHGDGPIDLPHAPDVLVAVAAVGENREPGWAAHGQV